MDTGCFVNVTRIVSLALVWVFFSLSLWLPKFWLFYDNKFDGKPYFRLFYFSLWMPKFIFLYLYICPPVYIPSLVAPVCVYLLIDFVYLFFCLPNFYDLLA